MLTITNGVKLIIFDCDGVLVDSEPLAIRVLRDTLERQGLRVSLEEAYSEFLGKSLSAVLDTLADTYQLRLGTAVLEAMRHELFDLFRAELRPVGGIAEALAAVARSCAICVASSSVPERLNLSLEVTGLSRFFGGRIFSASEVARGKPAPDLFLHAAKSLGIAPENCLVIEDSSPGIEAAKAAGMRVWGFTGGAHMVAAGLAEKIAAAKPDHVFSDMSQFPALIAIGHRQSFSERDARHLIAVDVGTASVRAGVLSTYGDLLARSEVPISVWRGGGAFGEYASEEIWSACCAAVRQVIRISGIPVESVAALGFDATCSLVVRDGKGHPLSISIETGAPRDTLAWFDHRALDEALEISAGGHPVLDYSGGALSPEMEIPKLKWLKRHRPETWARARLIFDLADFLTWKATGSLERSQSVLASKWAFLAHEPDGWRDDFLEAAGLADLREHASLPAQATQSGKGVGHLTPEASRQLGLNPGCIVSSGMIDAHAGAIGVLCEFLAEPENIHKHLGLIAGTSSCVMAVSEDPRHIRGIWGPYFGATAPGMWLNEGGQSASGALLDHVIRWHGAGGDPTAERHAKIVARIAELRGEQGAGFAADLHVLPDFHGNRSPLHDPRPRGMIRGLNLDSSFDGLCALYWRTAVGVTMGLRQILEVFRDNGYGGEELHIAGGHTQNPLLLELYTDATGETLATQPGTDALLLGTAMCASVAAGISKSLAEAGTMMKRPRTRIPPNPRYKKAYDRDYAEFLRMQSLFDTRIGRG